MTLIRWQPFQEIDTLQREMNRLFDDMLAPGARRDHNGSFIPAAELKETEDAVHLSLEVPGLEAKDLNVEVAVDTVSVTNLRQSRRLEEGAAQSGLYLPLIC